MTKHEQRILSALVGKLAKGGFPLLCIRSDFDETDELPVKTLPALRKVFREWDMYAPTIVFTDSEGQRHGVMVAEGNDESFIADWNCGNATFDAIVDSVSEAASEGAYS